MLLMHGLSYGPALTRNTKERASVCQSDQVGLRPPRVTSHPILTRTIFSSACLLFRTVVPNIIVPWFFLQNVDQLHFILLQSRTIITLWVQEKLTSQEKTLSQPLDNIFSRSRKGVFYIQDNKEHITTIRSEACCCCCCCLHIKNRSALLFLTLQGKETNFRGHKLTQNKVQKNNLCMYGCHI